MVGLFGEFRCVMLKGMNVIKAVHNIERKRTQTARKKRNEEISRRTPKAKSLIADIRKRVMFKEEIVRRVEGIFAKGRSQEVKRVPKRREDC